MSAAASPIVLAHGDCVRLTSRIASKIGRAWPTVTALLRDKLAAARVVDDERLPPDVVSMESRVLYGSSIGGGLDEVELVYPWDSAPELGRVSVFSPLGAALLGVRVGDVASWISPRGRRFAWTIEHVRAELRASTPRATIA